MVTYRVQFSPSFGFADAEALLPYLKRLGVDTLYASPVFEALPGSSHGYDWTDAARVRAELGGIDGLRSLAAALRGCGMRLLADFVPHHMAASVHNAWWRDVLLCGPRSVHAPKFDIDWQAGAPAVRGRILLARLSVPYAEALRAGGIVVGHAREGFTLDAAGEALPVNLAGQRRIAAWLAGRDSGGMHRLAAPAGDGEAQGLIHAVLEDQAYRLAFWQAADDSANYRRFFDVGTLAALRVEDPAVFDAVHAGLFALVREGIVQGVRLDHVDGLFDPTAYLGRLASVLGPAGVPIWVEKILSPDEALPEAWPVAGTVGYGYLNDTTRAFIEPRGRARLATLAGGASGRDFAALVRTAKREIAPSLFAAPLARLVERLADLAAADPAGVDCGPGALSDAVVELTARLDVYRTYVRDDGYAHADQARLERALAAAADGAAPRLRIALGYLGHLLLGPQDATTVAVVRTFERFTAPVQAKALEDTAFYRDVTLLSLNEVGGDPGWRGDGRARLHRENARRLADWPKELLATSTHDTKRSEDVRARLNVLAQMPGLLGERSRLLHERLLAAPGGAAAAAQLDRATELYACQTLVGLWPAEGALTAAEAERLQAHMLKAVREAARLTSWRHVRPAPEAAVRRLIDLVTEDAVLCAAMAEFAAVVAYFGALESLSQTLLKLGAPGTPDIYQGSEGFDLSLTDPDNRRPVAFAALNEALAEAAGGSWRRLVAQRPFDPRVKLGVVHAALDLRRALGRTFDEGRYVPLVASGEGARSVVAFARRCASGDVVVATSRYSVELARRAEGAGPDPQLPPRRAATGDAAWGDGRLRVGAGSGPRRWLDVLTHAVHEDGGHGIALADLFGQLPFALLSSTSDAIGSRQPMDL